MAIFVGLDVGTQGARAIACSEDGKVIARAERRFGLEVCVQGLPTGWFEQHPEAWWAASREALSQLTSGIRTSDIAAVAVDSTSGTIVAVDDNENAVRPAIMYSDIRSGVEADRCNSAGSDFISKLGYKFSSSFGLPKMLWIRDHEPDTWKKIRRLVHAADYIVAKLAGTSKLTDSSNALKSGYDLVDECWPSFITESLGIEREKLPDVVEPGEPIGLVSDECARATGLPAGTLVVSGVSDGTAGFFASGCSRVGEWNSTIGTTLVIRGVSRELVKDTLGRVYCHKHPDGYWLPGGASSVGAECLSRVFPDCDYGNMNAAVHNMPPTGIFIYPLVRRGERFPFVDGSAVGFVVGNPANQGQLYMAYLEGVGYVERWCVELMSELGAEVGDTVFTTGGGARSPEWIQIRADILGKRIIRPAVTDAAIGTAVVAASRTLFTNVEEASAAMIKSDIVVEPGPRRSAYQDCYSRFRAECASRGMGVQA
jgi:sugar (pentulose or hexulose) kinase